MPGRLFGLGVGPGDPELLTLKALRLLRAAPVVAYLAPEHGDSFARSIVAAWLEPEQREIAIRVPMRPGPPPAAIYDAATAILAAELDRGDDVALLCQGDPLFYGSFVHLLDRLAGRYRIEIVPGVSAIVACAAAASTPLATRDETLSVIPATLDEAEIARRLCGADAAAVVKLGRHFSKVRRTLHELGLIDNALYIERATLPNQRVAPIACVDAAAVPYFSMILIRRRSGQRLPLEHQGGSVRRFYESLGLTASLPLPGKVVRQAGSFAFGTTSPGQLTTAKTRSSGRTGCPPTRPAVSSDQQSVPGRDRVVAESIDADRRSERGEDARISGRAHSGECAGARAPRARGGRRGGSGQRNRLR